MEAIGNGLTREELGLQRPFVSAVTTVGTQELNDLIGQAATSRNLDDLAALVYYRLERRGAAYSASLILMAEDLYLVHKHELWKHGGYSTWAEWVKSEYSNRPYGRSYNTVMALINVWRFYAVQCKWPVEDLIVIGKAKLEVALGTARATATEIDGPSQIVTAGDAEAAFIVDRVLRATLLDTEVGHRSVMNEYRERVSTIEAMERAQRGEAELNRTNNGPLPERKPVYEANTGTGRLVVWLPMSPPKQDLAIELGRLNFGSESAEPWLTQLLHRARVKVK